MQHDVFVSYNSRDAAQVELIVRRLSERGLRPFFDRWYLERGKPWLEALEEHIASCRSVCVFHGPSDFGGWQKRERTFALDRQNRDPSFAVIPVLLPGSDASIGFLSVNTSVDLRHGMDDASIDALVRAIRGEVAPPSSVVAPTSGLSEVRPYRGLRAFREEDAPFFHGRAQFAQAVHGAVQKHSVVTVCGPSGSGKSSVLHAGLVPLLRASRAPVWEIVSTVPTDRPMHSVASALLPLLEPEMSEVDRLGETGKLAKALGTRDTSLRDVIGRILARQRGTDRLLLIVDQWEEIYQLCKDGAERAVVRDQLLDASVHAPLTLVIGVRADFFGTLLDDRSLVPSVHAGLVTVGPLDREQLRTAIVEPARRLGHEFEPGLADTILDEIEGEPGNLPLLEFALEELWNQRRAGLLTFAAFRRLGDRGCDSTANRAGGIRGSIAAHAERATASAVNECEPRLRRLFLRLVQATDDGGHTRRRARIADLDERDRQLAFALVVQRLLVASRDQCGGEQSIEIAHEALIQRWERLHKWLDEDREFLLWRRRLEDSRVVWETTHTDRARRESDALLRGTQLTEAVAWLGARGADLEQPDRDYIEFSQQRAQRTKTTVLLVCVVTGFVLIGLTMWSIRVATAASESARRVREQAVVTIARNWLDRDPTVSALLLASLDSNREPYYGLELASDVAHRALATVLLRGHDKAVFDARFSHDGQLIVTASEDRTARVWRADGSGQPIVLGGHEDSIVGAEFSRDGRFIVTASEDHTARVWRADGSGVPVVLRLGEEAGGVACAKFSPDGRFVVTASFDDTARVWRADGAGEPVELHMESGGVTHANFSDDGRFVVTSSEGGIAQVWRSDGAGEPVVLAGHDSRVSFGAFSPDGRRVVTASDDHTARVWNADGSGSPVELEGHTAPVRFAAFSPDGRRVATASDDHTARVWNADGIGIPVTLEGHTAALWTVAFSPDGRRVVTASADCTARVWVLDNSCESFVLGGHTHSVTSAAFSPDGRRIVTASWDTTVRVWNADGPGEPIVLSDHTCFPASAAFSPDGCRVVAAYDDHTARVWNADGSGEPVVLSGHAKLITSAAFSSDGRRVVTASYDDTARVWSADGSGEPVILRGHSELVWSAAFSPDGRRVVTASADETARVWNADGSGEPVVLRGCKTSVVSAVFSPDGRRVVTTASDDTAQVWNADGSGEPVILRGHTDAVGSAAFSPDGRRIVTASLDGTARVWKVDGSGEPVVLRGHADAVWSAAFSPDGRRVVTRSRDNTARVWNADGSGEAVVLRGHMATLSSAVFSSDGRRVVTASGDITARVWNANGAGEPITLRGHTHPVSSAAFSPDGHRVATASGDRTVRVWRVSWPALLDYLRNATTAELSVRERIEFLGETPDDAERNFRERERARDRNE